MIDDAEEVEIFAHLMSARTGTPHDDDGFDGVVRSLGGHLASVRAIDDVPVEPSRAPAPTFDPRP